MGWEESGNSEGGRMSESIKIIWGIIKSLSNAFIEMWKFFAIFLGVVIIIKEITRVGLHEYFSIFLALGLLFWIIENMFEIRGMTKLSDYIESKIWLSDSEESDKGEGEK